ncbi:unnamed protein product [Haemonchus placei]|uniref:Transposase n=1 Tax=Haemonchus placei TaxID=6290 RepID=A0A0N4X8I0_HAEPC|nr:unnamed protein product [Haemonchus placei]
MMAENEIDKEIEQALYDDQCMRELARFLIVASTEVVSTVKTYFGKHGKHKEPCSYTPNLAHPVGHERSEGANGQLQRTAERTADGSG